jgi:hypothetical protein
LILLVFDLFVAVKFNYLNFSRNSSKLLNPGRAAGWRALTSRRPENTLAGDGGSPALDC